MMKNGFTITEVLVAVAVFVVIIGAALNLFVSGIQTQRQTVQEQTLVNELSFATEYMSRALRQAQKAEDTSCLSQAGYNFRVETSAGIDRLRFLDKDGVCREFFLETSQVKERINFGPVRPLTSGAIVVNEFKFQLRGESQADAFQPRVSLMIEAQAAGGTASLRMQTSIIQRALDVEELL